MGQERAQSLPPATIAAVCVLSFFIMWCLFASDCDRRHNQSIFAVGKKTCLFCRPFKNLTRSILRFFGHSEPNHVPRQSRCRRQNTVLVIVEHRLKERDS
jgi:hypothetical protein